MMLKPKESIAVMSLAAILVVIPGVVREPFAQSRMKRPLSMPAAALMAGSVSGDGRTARVHGGFEDFSQGQFENGGSNLYVNANGIIEMIHRWDVNNDGFVDLVLANSHDYIERGPTHVFTLGQGGNDQWTVQEMSADSGWMSRIVDLDKDGFADLIVANGENGVTSELPSYVYWGEAKGLGSERTDLPTLGAYDVAVLDLNRDGHLDLIFPSAWQDHHNPGKPLPVRVYLGQRGRKFQDATSHYSINGISSVSIAAGDLNRDGFSDLVVANYRLERDLNVESFVYWGTEEGVDAKAPLRLPTYGAQQVLLADLNHDGMQDIVFSGGNQVRIYWNRSGRFDASDFLMIRAEGYSSMFSTGAVRCAVKDLNADGKNDLILATAEGIQMRSGQDLRKVEFRLPLRHVHWVTASDLNGDSLPDLVVSRYSDGTVYDTKSPIFWNSPEGFSLDRATWLPTRGAVGNTAGDLNGDGGPEVVFNNTLSGHLRGIYNYVYLGNQKAAYGTANRLDLPSDGSDQAVIADLDLDGYPELAFTQGALRDTGWATFVRIYQGGPQGPSPGRHVDLPAKKVLQDLRVADFNRDGYLDLLTLSQVYDTKPETLAKSGMIFYGGKDGFSASRVESLEHYGHSGHLADVNRDGYLDVLLNDKRGYVLIYLGGRAGFSKKHTRKVPVPRPGGINTADINKDGWLDLIVGSSGHYVRLKDTLHIFYGSPHGFDPHHSQELLAGYSPGRTAVADFNNDENLDVLVSAYSTATARVIPAQLFWGNGKTLDLDHPVNLPAESSAAATHVDLNRDGWIDIVLACHRNDLGHQVDSLIYWNSPKGFSTDLVTGLPGLGPHGMTTHDRGNAYTRKPEETYVSPAFDMENQTASRIDWSAEVPPPSQLRFQLRWAASKGQLEQTPWMGPGGENTYFEESGQEVQMPSGARWLQYRAIFVSPYGCRSPRLSQVRVGLRPRGS